MHWTNSRNHRIIYLFVLFFVNTFAYYRNSLYCCLEPFLYHSLNENRSVKCKHAQTLNTYRHQAVPHAVYKGAGIYKYNIYICTLSTCQPNKHQCVLILNLILGKMKRKRMYLKSWSRKLFSFHSSPCAQADMSMRKQKKFANFRALL